MVLIRLGPKQTMTDATEQSYQTAYVHKDLLCEDSEFFRAATKPEWQNSAVQTVDLTDEDPATFAVFVINLREGCRAYPPKEAIRIAYAGTAESSPIRKLLVDYWVKVSHRGWDTKNLTEKTSPEFVEDLIVALIDARPVPNTYVSYSEDPEKYYVKTQHGKSWKSSG